MPVPSLWYRAGPSFDSEDVGGAIGNLKLGRTSEPALGETAGPATGVLGIVSAPDAAGRCKEFLSGGYEALNRGEFWAPL